MNTEVSPAYTKQVEPLVILEIVLQRPVYELARHIEAARTVESIDFLLPVGASETYINKALEDADKQLSTIEDAIKRYREGRQQAFQELP